MDNNEHNSVESNNSNNSAVQTSADNHSTNQKPASSVPTSSSSDEFNSNDSSSRGRTLSIIIIIAIIAVGAYWLISGAETSNAPIVEDDNEASGSNLNENSSSSDDLSLSGPIGNALISVSDQPAGSTIIIASADLDKASWVAIREERDGGIGNILGAQWLPAGSHQDVAVNLLRPALAGKKYYVTIFADDGDKQFNYKVDEQLTADDGETISFTFMAE